MRCFGQCPASRNLPLFNLEFAHPFEGTNRRARPVTTEVQITGMIKEQETGLPTAQMRRRNGLSQEASNRLKSQNGGMKDADAAKLLAITDE